MTKFKMALMRQVRIQTGRIMRGTIEESYATRWRRDRHGRLEIDAFIVDVPFRHQDD